MNDEKVFRRLYGLESSFEPALERSRDTENRQSSTSAVAPQPPVVSRLRKQFLEQVVDLQNDDTHVEQLERALKATDVLSSLFDPPTDKELLTTKHALDSVVGAVRKAIAKITDEESMLARRGRHPWYRCAPPKLAGFDDALLENMGPGMSMRMNNVGTDPIVLLLVVEELLQFHMRRVDAMQPTLQLKGKDRHDAILDQIVMTLLEAEVGPGDVSVVLKAKGFDAKVSSERAINTRAHRLRKLGWQQPRRKGRGRPRSR